MKIEIVRQDGDDDHAAFNQFTERINQLETVTKVKGCRKLNFVL